jgi:hypothetical protein
LEEHEVEMAHQPFGCQVIPIPDFGHQVVKAHVILLNGILSNSLLKAIIISDFLQKRDNALANIKIADIILLASGGNIEVPAPLCITMGCWRKLF